MHFQRFGDTLQRLAHVANVTAIAVGMHQKHLAYGSSSRPIQWFKFKVEKQIKVPVGTRYKQLQTVCGPCTFFILRLLYPSINCFQYVRAFLH